MCKQGWLISNVWKQVHLVSGWWFKCVFFFLKMGFSPHWGVEDSNLYAFSWHPRRLWLLYYLRFKDARYPHSETLAIFRYPRICQNYMFWLCFLFRCMFFWNLKGFCYGTKKGNAATPMLPFTKLRVSPAKWLSSVVFLNHGRNLVFTTTPGGHSYEQWKKSWLFRVYDTTQWCGDDSEPLFIRIPINQPQWTVFLSENLI